MDPNPRFFTKTFYRFLGGFLLILALAFGVFLVGSQFQTTPAAVGSQQK